MIGFVAVGNSAVTQLDGFGARAFMGFLYVLSNRITCR